MKKSLIAGFIILVGLSIPSFAERVTQGGVTLDYTISGGGGILYNADRTVTLQDIKAQPLAGRLEVDGIVLQIGGIPVMAGAVESDEEGGVEQPPIIIPLIDSGRIRNTWIERIGNSVTLHWGFNDAGPTSVDIWLKRDTDIYRRIIAAYPREINQILVTGVTIGDGRNYFFRVVPSGIADADIENPVHNSITVAKFDLPLVKKYNLISIPLIPTAAPPTGIIDPSNYQVQSAIGDQLNEGDQIYLWNYDNQSYNGVTKTASWPNFEIRPLDAYFIYLRNVDSARISIVGRVINTTLTKEIREKYNSVGQAYPVIRLDPTAGGFTAPAGGDQIYKWNATNQTFNGSTYNGSSWDPTGLIRLEPGNGYFYYRRVGEAPLNWSPPLP